MIAGDARRAKLEAEGQSTIHAIFFNQMLEPYMKNNDLWKNQQYSNAWVNFQDKGTNDPGFHSYGGQNSYAANNYLLKKNEGFSATAVEGVSNTLLFVDATYYNALPAQPAAGLCDLNGVVMRTNNDEFYWKNLGNNQLNFNAKGTADPDSADNVQTVKNVEARYNGVLNVVRVDSSAKALNAKGLINDLRVKGTQSMWNPGKTPCTNGTVLPQ
ncbi:hypothetical protein EON79_12995 [bacterium]|nr:MAG: hypothetical protein EON79_12995 [bacterium]